MSHLVKPMLFAALASTMLASAAKAEDVSVGIGFGVGFLPLYIADEQNLLEKYGKEAGLDLNVTYQRISGSAAMQDAVMSGSVSMGAYGLPALLIAWDRARDTPQQILGIAGVNASPLTLVTNKPDVKSLKDFSTSDRIAMPSLVSPQMYFLQMASEKEFGAENFNQLRSQVVSLPHPEALNSVTSGSTEVTAYFSPPPFTQLALRSGKAHAVFNSEDVVGGKASFLVLGGRKAFLDENPKIAEAAIKAIDEAAAFIRSNPEKAAEIYLKIEPSKSLTQADAVALIKESADDFGADVFGVKAFADFMQRHSGLRQAPERWQDVFIANMQDRKGS